MSTSVPASTARRPSTGFVALAGVVIVAAVGVRLALLGRESYWIDEIFSVNETSGSLGHLVKVGSTEVHTPFYAGLLWGWITVLGPHTAETRLLSVVFAVIAVVVSYRGLLAVPLGQHVRWALTVAIAAGGTSIVYSLETRSYALLMLGSVGLTIATLRAALLTLEREEVPGRVVVAWGGWAVLAATAHLFGAVLALAAAGLLVVLTLIRIRRSRVRRVLVWIAVAGLGCSLQALWILAGLGRPGFAGGTDWIQAPDRWDLRDLLTTTFSSGTLTPHKDGFAWASPIGVIVVAGLGLVAAGYGFWARSGGVTATAEETAGEETTREGAAAAILLVLAAIVIVGVFAVSQRTHLWTLRNLVIVTPALTWGVICLLAAAAGTAAGRRAVATVVVALLGLSLVPTAIGLRHPYKTDFRGLTEYLISVRAAAPEAEFVFLGKDGPGPWKAASERAADDPAWDTLYRHAVRYRRAASYPSRPQDARTLAGGRVPAQRPAAPVVPAGPRVVTYSHGVANPHLDREAATLVARLGAGCRRIPIYGLIVVRCD